MSITRTHSRTRLSARGIHACAALTRSSLSASRAEEEPGLEALARRGSGLEPGLDPHTMQPPAWALGVRVRTDGVPGGVGALRREPVAGGGHAASLRVRAVRAQRTARPAAPTWTGDHVPQHTAPPATADAAFPA